MRIWVQAMTLGHHLELHKYECDYAIVCVEGDVIEADILPGAAPRHTGAI